MNKKHNCKNTRLYRIYYGMRTRCYNKNDRKKYALYGGRGIRICEEWKDNFIVFKEWALKNGYNDNLSIDRININGNYEPSNCRWISNQEQQNNKRNNTFLIYKNEKKTVAQWSRETGLSQDIILYRIKKGWSADKILTTPRMESKVRKMK